MELFVKRQGDYLVPTDEDSLNRIRKLKENTVRRVSEKEERNYNFLKKFMALVKLGNENSRLDMPFDAYRKYVTCKAGFCKIYTTPKGHYVEPDSIAFDKMDEETFRDVYKRVRDVVSGDIGATSEEIDNNLSNFY